MPLRDADFGSSLPRQAESWSWVFCSLSLSATEALVDQTQAFVRTGGHGQGEGLAVDAEMAQFSHPAHMGDLDVVRGKEADDFLIAGVAAHGRVRG